MAKQFTPKLADKFWRIFKASEITIMCGFSPVDWNIKLNFYHVISYTNHIVCVSFKCIIIATTAVQ